MTLVPALMATKLPGEGWFCVFSNSTTIIQTELNEGGVCNVQDVLNKLTELSVISLSEFLVCCQSSITGLCIVLFRY